MASPKFLQKKNIIKQIDAYVESLVIIDSYEGERDCLLGVKFENSILTIKLTKNQPAQTKKDV